MNTEQNCIFCKIVAGEIPCYKVFEDEKHLGFLTIKPNVKGHVVLIPKSHIEDIMSANDSSYEGIFKSGKIIANKIKEIFKSKRVCFMLSGLEVSHLHLLLFPINSAKELDFNLAYDLTKEEAQEILSLYQF